MQEEPTNTTETTEGTETSGNPAQGSSTSTTDQPEKIDLAGDATTTETDKVEDEGEDTRTDEQKAADDEAEAARAELFGAPAEGEEYQIEGLPEGMSIDKEALEAVSPIFRKLGLSSKGASEVAAVYAEKVLPHVSQQVVSSLEQDIITQRKSWEDDAVEAVKQNGQTLKNKAGEVLSFDAQPMEEVRKVAARALDRIAPDGFRDWLKETGLSVHPQMIAFTYQAGKLLAEDTVDAADTDNSNKDNPRAKARAGGLTPSKFYNRS